VTPEQVERLLADIQHRYGLVAGVEQNTTKILCDYSKVLHGRDKDPTKMHSTDAALTFCRDVESERAKLIEERDRLRAEAANANAAHDAAVEWSVQLRERAENAEAEQDRLREALRLAREFVDASETARLEVGYILAHLRAAIGEQEPNRLHSNSSENVREEAMRAQERP
jgi:hypothetical protein